MRLIAAVAAVLALAGCAPKESGSQASGTAAAAASDVADAKVFIQTHLNDASSSSQETKDGMETIETGFEKYSGLSLGETWTWTEELSSNSTSHRGTDSVINIELHHKGAYSVRASDLSLPVAVKTLGDAAWLELECGSGKCISVDGVVETKLQPALTPDGGPHPMQTPVDMVAWSFSTKEEADRAAKAVTVLLTSAGAKERKF